MNSDRRRATLGALVLLFLIIIGDFVAGLVGVASRPPATPPNHPPLYFWGNPGTVITLAGVQGSGQTIPLAYAGTHNACQNCVNEALHAGTIYCTGLTSDSLSPVLANDNITASAEMLFQSQNVTGQTISITLYIGASGVVPSSTFGAGHCASITGSVVFSTNIYFPQTTNYFSITMFKIKLAALGTYYSWVEIQPLSTNVLVNENAQAQIEIREDSTGKAPALGSPSASSDLATGAPPDSPTAVELPATQTYRQAAKLQSQTTTARLIITIGISAVAGGGLSGDTACGTCTPVWIQYSADGVTWHDLCGDGTETPRIDIQQAASSTPYKSAFCTMQTGAFADNLFRTVWDNGAGGATQLKLIELELAP